MLSNARARRAVTAAVVAAAVASVGAATADARSVSATDDTALEFAQGTRAETVVRTLAGGDGAVELARTLEEQFDGSALPATWSSTPWSTGGTATIAAGALVVDGTLVNSGVPAGPGSSLQFTADLGTAPFGHVGFATDFDSQPWAMFSTGGGALTTGLYARTSDGTAGPLPNSDTPLTVAPGKHLYRIDWTATEFVYFVDTVEVARHPITLAEMPVGASDFDVGGGGVSIDSIVMSKHKTGTFTSRSFDAGDARVTALALAATSDTPAGTAVGYETRSSDTEPGLATAAWAPLGAGGAVASPPKRYLQYRATLTTPDATVTPRLNKVDVGFTVDDQAPVVTIGGVAVTGATAKVTFAADDASAVVKCKLDDAVLAGCTSPATFSGLADGSHTIVVQATDPQANVGSDTKTFVVDTQAPKVTIADVAVSGGSARVTFGSDDAAASFKCRLDGAGLESCASPAQFSGLAAGAHTIVVQATDGHGNVGSATRTFDVVATPSGGSGGAPPPSGHGSTPDVTAPKVILLARSVRVSDGGIAKLRVRCPRSEVSCSVVLKLKLGARKIANGTLTMPGGTKRAATLRLSRAARAALGARSRLKVTAVVTARDEAGNQRTTRRRMTLRAPAL